jgi:ligand-binding sensor domain-containing protein
MRKVSKLNGDEVLMRYRMRYRKARSKRERSALVDEAEVQETLYKATIRQKEAKGRR